MANQADIIDSLLPNTDLAKFWELADTAKDRLCRRVQHVTMIGYDGPGYYYQDYVVTITCAANRKKYEIVRNRTGSLVFSVNDGKITARNYEIIFIETHLRKKLGLQLDG